MSNTTGGNTCRTSTKSCLIALACLLAIALTTALAYKSYVEPTRLASAEVLEDGNDSELRATILRVVKSELQNEREVANQVALERLENQIQFDAAVDRKIAAIKAQEANRVKKEAATRQANKNFILEVIKEKELNDKAKADKLASDKSKALRLAREARRNASSFRLYSHLYI